MPSFKTKFLEHRHVYLLSKCSFLFGADIIMSCVFPLLKGKNYWHWDQKPCELVALQPLQLYWRHSVLWWQPQLGWMIHPNLASCFSKSPVLAKWFKWQERQCSWALSPTYSSRLQWLRDTWSWHVVILEAMKVGWRKHRQPRLPSIGPLSVS